MKTSQLAAIAAATALALPLAACGGGGNWPYGKTDADSVACEYEAGEAAAQLRAIPGVEDAEASIAGPGCIGYEGDASAAHTRLWVYLGDQVDAAQLVATQGAAREVFLDAVAPRIRTNDTLVLDFNGGSTLQFSDGNLVLGESEMEAITTFTGNHPGAWLVVAPKVTTPSVDDAAEAWYITADTTVEAQGVSDLAEIAGLLEPVWADLNTLGGAVEPRTSNEDGFIPSIVVSDADYEGAMSGPFIIQFEYGTDFDARWAEAAARALQLAEQPEVEKVWMTVSHRERYNNAEITLVEPGSELSERSQELVEEIYELLDGLQMPAAEPTMKA